MYCSATRWTAHWLITSSASSKKHTGPTGREGASQTRPARSTGISPSLKQNAQQLLVHFKMQGIVKLNSTARHRGTETPNSSSECTHIYNCYALAVGDPLALVGRMGCKQHTRAHTMFVCIAASGICDESENE